MVFTIKFTICPCTTCKPGAHNALELATLTILTVRVSRLFAD